MKAQARELKQRSSSKGAQARELKQGSSSKGAQASTRKAFSRSHVLEGLVGIYDDLTSEHIPGQLKYDDPLFPLCYV